MRVCKRTRGRRVERRLRCVKEREKAKTNRVKDDGKHTK